VLDQGYYSDGIYLPATPRGFEYDILTLKSLGFNMLRKHIKIEPDLFYYYCDKYGMIVFQDMVNSGKYSFIRDTALPTIGFKKGGKRKASEYRKKHFEENTRETVQILYNHPCVCYYTIFNEGWGQYEADRLYDLCKSLDDSRVWDTTSGWFKETKSDVESEHIYFKPICLSPTEKPLVLSEFGGYSLKINENSFNPYKTYGYKKFTNSKEFETEIEKLYLEQIIPAIENGLCAAVLTQLSDVEDETNGLLTYDRQVLKIDQEKMKNISDKLLCTYKEKFK
jgi:beta-galactosidase/beta-glucuronidase